MHPTPIHNDADEGDNTVQNSDNDDFNEGDDVLQENNM